MRRACSVNAVHSYPIPMIQRRLRDGSVPTNPHMTFHTILEFCEIAWQAAFAEACGDLINKHDLAVVTIATDYRREMRVGDAEWQVALTRIGGSSMNVVVEGFQEGLSAVATTATLVLLNHDHSGSQQISAQQRVGLETLLVE